jgi:hypothetical protein
VVVEAAEEVVVAVDKVVESGQEEQVVEVGTAAGQIEVGMG